MRGGIFAILFVLSVMWTNLALAAAPVSWSTMPFGSVEITKWHLDIDVSSDGSYVEASELGLRVLDSRGQKALQQVTLWYSEGLQTLDVASAYTLKANGEKIAVGNDQMLRGFGATSAPGFEDLKTITLVFPRLDVGDQIVLTTLRRQIVPLFTGAFAMREDFSPAIRAQDVQITLTSPQGALPVSVDAVGLDGGDRQQFAGKFRWVWRYHNDKAIDPGPDAVVATDNQPHLVASSFPNWEAVGKAYGEHFAGKADVTPDIQSLADQLTKGEADRKAQAKTLYEWVTTNIAYVNIVLGAGGFTPHSAAQVLATHYGDCKDHVMLLQALLAAKGIASNPALIAANGPYAISKVPSGFYFNHLITFVPEFGMFLDSTARYAPFGVVPFFDADRPIVLVPSGEVSKTPNISADARTSKTQVTVKFDADGTAEADSRNWSLGDAAFAQRSLFDLVPPDKQKEMFGMVLGVGADVSIDDGNLRSLTDPFAYSIHYRVPNAAAFPGPGAVSSNTSLGPFVFGALVLGILPSSRSTTYFCPSGTSEETDRYEFPQNVQITSLPRPADIAADGLRFHMEYHLDGPHTVSATRTLRTEHPRAFCTPEYYASVRPHLARIAASLRAQVLYK